MLGNSSRLLFLMSCLTLFPRAPCKSCFCYNSSGALRGWKHGSCSDWLIPTMHSIVSMDSGYHAGQQLWFGLVLVYGSMLYVPTSPGSALRKTSSAIGNITLPCLIKYFGRRFSTPVLGTWNFYLDFIAHFGLHGSATVKTGQGDEVYNVHDVHGKKLRGRLPGIKWEVGSLLEEIYPELDREKILLLLYLLYFLLQVISQCIFLCLLLFLQRSLIKQGSIFCSTSSCPGPYCCLIRTTVEKLMSIHIFIPCPSQPLSSAQLALRIASTITCWRTRQLPGLTVLDICERPYLYSSKKPFSLTRGSLCSSMTFVFGAGLLPADYVQFFIPQN